MRCAIDKKGFADWIGINRTRIVRNLSDYIAIDTTSPHEADAFPFLRDYLTGVGFETWLEPIHQDTFNHRHRCPPPLSKISAESRNLRARMTAGAGTATILASCHIDVVPASKEWTDAFRPRVSDGAVFGRGACDTKGNLIMLAEALRFLRDSNRPIAKNVDLDCVIEEEVGGNGALSTALYDRKKADGALILEPTSLKCFRAHRGCLGFSITISGHGAHMASAESFVGPVQAACRLIDALARLESDLICEAKREPAFGQWKRPVQINVGRIEGGEWHGTTVERCSLMVNMGFPPSCDLDRAEQLVRNIVAELGASTGLTFSLSLDGIRNDAYINSADNPFILGFVDALADAGLNPGEVNGWNVSCDARTYARQLGVPALIFGCGNLADAHSDHEKIALDELFAGIFALSVYFSRPAL